MMRQTLLAIVLFLVMGVSIGCSSGKGAGKTPKETLSNMQQALLDGESKKFADCFDVSAEEKKALVSLCNFSHAMVKMQEALVDEYGDDGSQGGFNAQMDKLRNKDWLDNLDVKIDGDNAYVKEKGNLQTIQLVKKDDLWRITSGVMMPTADAEQLAHMIKMFDAMSEACETITDKIGSKGYSSDKAAQELSEIMMKHMMTIKPSNQAPPRGTDTIQTQQQSGPGTITITPSPKPKK